MTLCQTNTISIQIAAGHLAKGLWYAEIESVPFMFAYGSSRKKAVERVQQMFESAMQGLN